MKFYCALILVITVAVSVVVTFTTASVVDGGDDALVPCFMSIGDFGSANSYVQGIATTMQKVQSNPAAFGCASCNTTILNGDNCYNSGYISEHDPRWQTIFVDQFKNKLPGMKYLVSLGDHDAADQATAMIPNVTRMMAQVNYYKNIDSSYYIPDFNYSYIENFGGNNNNNPRVKFIVLNGVGMHACLHQTDASCSMFGSLEQQVNWIEQELLQSDNDPSIDAVLLVTHFGVVNPLYGHYDPKLDAVLVPIARKHRVSMIISAHSHFLSWSQNPSSTLGSNYPSGQLSFLINGAARGAAPYRCSHFPEAGDVALPVANLTCMSAQENEDGMFMLHRVTKTGFENIAFDGRTQSKVGSFFSSFRGK